MCMDHMAINLTAAVYTLITCTSSGHATGKAKKLDLIWSRAESRSPMCLDGSMHAAGLIAPASCTALARHVYLHALCFFVCYYTYLSTILRRSLLSSFLFQTRPPQSGDPSACWFGGHCWKLKWRQAPNRIEIQLMHAMIALLRLLLFACLAFCFVWPKTRDGTWTVLLRSFSRFSFFSRKRIFHFFF